MKKISIFFVIAAQAVLFACSTAKNAPAAALQNISIHTSGQCGMCLDKIETRISAMAGVKSAKLDLKTGNLSVQFNAEKIQEAKIKKALTDLGYDADELKGDAEAYKNLPACCKKP